MDRRGLVVVIGMLAVGAIAGLFLDLGGAAPARSAAPAVAPAPEAAPSDDPLSELDRRIEAHRELAESREGDWVTYETIAGLYADRARMSGDYQDYRRADAAYARAFEIAPDGVGPFLARAGLHYTLHRLDAAERDLEGASRGILTVAERRAIRSYRADIAFHRGDYETAARLYEEQLAEERSAPNLVALAQYSWSTGDFDRAASLLDEARAGAVAPSTIAWLELVRGTMELERGRAPDAIARFEAGLAAVPDDRTLRLRIADARYAAHDLDPAEAAYLAIAEEGDDALAIDGLARIARDRGDRAALEGLRERARALYEDQLAVLPEAAVGHALDHFLELEDDPARAVELAERNRDLRPGGEARTKLAQAYLRAGRRDEARAEITGVLETAWSTASAHGTAALALGDDPRAEDERARAEAIAPGTMERLSWLDDAL